MGDMKTSALKGAAKFLPASTRLNLINEYIDEAIDVANKEIDIASVQQQYAMGEDRSILLKIKGFNEEGVTIKFESGKLYRIANIDKPTVVVVLGENDFIQMARGISTIDDVIYFSRESDIEGDYWFRDILVLTKLFNAFNYVREKFDMKI